MSKYALGLCFLALASVGFGATLVSTQGIFSDPNQVFEQSFSYDPAVQGGTIIIQTYGYGGSANGSIVANTGRNLAGNIVSAGGFDPIIGLFGVRLEAAVPELILMMMAYAARIGEKPLPVSASIPRS